MVAAIAALIAAGHLPSFGHRLLDGDEGNYAAIATLMNAGGRLYADGGVENKPPGIFWTYALTFRLFGNYQMTAVHAVALVVVLLTAAVIFLIGRQVVNDRVGLFAALFYGVFTAAGNPRLLAANSELFMMLPLAASVLLMLQRRWLWSGALLVAAGLFKQPAGANILLLPLALLLLEQQGGRTRAALQLLAGIGIGLVIGAALIALTGSLTGFWRWTVQVLYGYASSNWKPPLLWMRAQDSIIPFAVASAVLWIAAAGYVAQWKRVDVQGRLMVAWLVVSGLGALSGGHWSWHYFIQVMGPLAVIAAMGIDRALNTSWQRWVAAATAAGVAVPMVLWGAFDVRADPLTYDWWRPPIAQHERVAAWIHDHTNPDDRIFVWGNWAPLYVESDRLMASRFPGFLRGFARGSGDPPNNWDTAPDVWPLLQSDLAAHPPALIVDTAAAGWSDFSMYPMTNYPVLSDLVAREYVQVATVDGVVIYAKR